MPEPLPYWPLLMRAKLASAYVGRGERKFRQGVGKIWPRPIKIDGLTVWDRRKLDEAVDQLRDNARRDRQPGPAAAVNNMSPLVV